MRAFEEPSNNSFVKGILFQKIFSAHLTIQPRARKKPAPLASYEYGRIPEREEIVMVSTDEARTFNQVNTIVDIHAHPVLKTYLFDYNLYEMHENHFPFIDFNPFYLLTDIPKLLQGGC